MKVTKQTFATFTRKKVPLANTIHHSSFLYNQFKKLNLCKFYSNRVINHLMSILISIFISGYHGKITDFAKSSSCHRTTIAHFLNSGKWNDSLLSDALKQAVIEIIYSEAARTGKPVFCIVDDSYPEKAFDNPKALRAFISTNVALSTQKILSCYVSRWSIEIFFRQCKDKLALDGYQLCSAQGIKRYWLLMSLAHFMCIAGTDEFCSFETSYHKICDIVQLEKYRYLFQCAKKSNDFNSFIKLAG